MTGFIWGPPVSLAPARISFTTNYLPGKRYWPDLMPSQPGKRYWPDPLPLNKNLLPAGIPTNENARVHLGVYWPDALAPFPPHPEYPSWAYLSWADPFLIYGPEPQECKECRCPPQNGFWTAWFVPSFFLGSALCFLFSVLP
nr:hypothetical protein Q903MT_gene3216 [Picea sitchensis]